MSDDIILTYNSLYTSIRNEKKNKDLQKLPENFYSLLKKFTENKKREVIELKNNKDAINFKKQKKLLENIETLKTEIINLRLLKISNIAITNFLFSKEIIEIEPILDIEKNFFLEIKKNSKVFLEEVKNE